jgi:hypothetical protein
MEGLPCQTVISTSNPSRVSRPPCPPARTLLWQGSPIRRPCPRSLQGQLGPWLSSGHRRLARQRAFPDGGFGPPSPSSCPTSCWRLQAMASSAFWPAPSARAAIYSITTHRVILRIGAALAGHLDRPLHQDRLRLAGHPPDDRHRHHRAGTGSRSAHLLPRALAAPAPRLRPQGPARLPLHPRCRPVARILSDAAQTRVNEPVVTFAPPRAHGRGIGGPCPT